MPSRCIECSLACCAMLLGCGTIQEIPVEGTSGASSSESGDMASTDHDPVEDTTAGTGVGTESTTEGGSETSEPAPEADPICTVDSIAIPDDGSWVEHAVEIPPGAGTAVMTAAARANHTRVSDLEIEVVSPAKLTATMLSAPPCDGADVAIVFDDAADLSAAEQCTAEIPAIEGRLRPLQSLAPLLEGEIAGTWLVRARDLQPEHSGALESVCLWFGTKQ